MKTLFISTHYNAPHFMKLQLESFNIFIKGEFDLVIMNDAGAMTKSLFSNRLARTEIYEESQIHNLKHIYVPQSIHANICDGGLVPNGFPASHPTERHRAHLHWIIKNHKSLGFNEYDIIVFIESDMFARKNINLESYMEDYDLMGPGRKNVHLVRERNNPNQHWAPQAEHLDEITIDLFPMYMLFVNMHTVKNLENLDIGGFAGSDTGGKTYFFLQDNPQYKHFFMNAGGDLGSQVDFISKSSLSSENAEFIHYRAGSNWDSQSIEYYREKLNRLVKYIPQLTYEAVPQEIDLISRDKEHIFYKEKSLITEKLNMIV